MGYRIKYLIVSFSAIVFSFTIYSCVEEDYIALELEKQYQQLDLEYTTVDLETLRPNFPDPLNNEFLEELKEDLEIMTQQNINLGEIRIDYQSANKLTAKNNECSDPNMILIPAGCENTYYANINLTNRASVVCTITVRPDGMIECASNFRGDHWIWQSWVQQSWRAPPGPTGRRVITIRGLFTSGGGTQTCPATFTVTQDPWAGGRWQASYSGGCN